MTYLLMSLALLTVAAAVAAWLRKYWQPRVLLISGLVLTIITAVFDNLIIATGIVAYDSAKISGVLIGVAPIEDFSYTLGGLLILPAIWNWLKVKL